MLPLKPAINLKPIVTINLNFVRYTRNTTKYALINHSQKYDVYHIPKQLFNDYYNYPLDIDPLGQRLPGFWFKNHFKYIKEMEPELIVPDLLDFPLKAYVSYKAEEINTPEFTAKALFDKTYAPEILDKVMKDQPVEIKIDEAEILEAKLKALRPNSDMLEPDPDELNLFTK